MPAGPTYSTMGTGSLAGVSEFIFSSIPSTYTDLVLIGANITRSVANSVLMQFNGDTSASYAQIRMTGTGSAGSSYEDTGNAYVFLAALQNGLSNTPTNFRADIFGYTSDQYKTVFSKETDSGVNVNFACNSWSGTSAITSIRVFAAGNFTTGTVSLYGIAAA